MSVTNKENELHRSLISQQHSLNVKFRCEINHSDNRSKAQSLYELQSHKCACLIYTWNAHFIRHELRFKDRSWEKEYLKQALNSTTNRHFAIGAKIVVFMVVLALAMSYMVDFTNSNSTSDIDTAKNLAAGWLCCMAVLILVAVVLHLCRYCATEQNKVVFTTSATIIAFFAGYIYLPYSFAADQVFLLLYEHCAINFMRVKSNFSTYQEICNYVNLNQTGHGGDAVNDYYSQMEKEEGFIGASETDGHYNDTAFSAMSTQTRL